MRLIDADALMDKIKKCVNSEEGYVYNFLNSAQEPSVEWSYVEDLVDNAPTIEPSGDKGGDAEVTVIPEGTGLMQQSPNDGADLISRSDALKCAMWVNTPIGEVQAVLVASLKDIPPADRNGGQHE